MVKRSGATVVCLLFSLCFSLLQLAVGGGAEEGFVAIFNGKDLTNWDGNPRFWSVRDGAIHGETTQENPTRGNTFCLWRGGVLSDFELRLQFRIRNGNSGVQVRSRDRGSWVVGGYQVEVTQNSGPMGLFYDERGKRGGLARIAEKVRIDAKGEKKVVGSLGDPKQLQSVYNEKAYEKGEWNEMTVIGRGNTLVQKINGVVFSELTDEQEGVHTTSGILALQIHAGPPMVVEFKNIRLKQLKEEDAPGQAPKGESKNAGLTMLFNGKDLTGWKLADKYDFEDHGKVYAKDGVLYLEEGKPMTGIQWAGEFPKSNYEVSVEAMRISGSDFFCGMTFPVGPSWATWINGGWGGNVVGLSNVDDMNASENETSQGRSFEDKRWYRFRLRVTDEKIECWIDDEKVIEIARQGRRFSVWDEQSPIKPFGVATWHTGGALRNFTLKRLSK